MPAITLIVTNAGRAALVDAATAGTFAVRIASAGLTASSFTPLATATALPGEFARITGVSGDAIDPDTITLVIRDDSSAVYTLRGLGLFLADGTLFAIYSQATPILEKAANSTALIVLDVRFADIAATSLTFGDANFLNPPATTSVQGVIEIATNAEAIAGTDDQRAITPASLKALVDNRFGAGAASTFVKTLLTAATAAAFRLTLGIKSAALKDEGSGNGLDADTLDGHHLRIGANAVTWPGVPLVQADGVMEVGSRLDFHATNNDPADFTVSLGMAGANFARSGNQIWDAGNDGAGSGLDADLLDGQDGSFYTNIVARLGYTPYNLAAVPAAFGVVQNGVSISSIDPDAVVIGSSYFSTHSNNGYGGSSLAYVVTLAGGDAPGRGFQLSSANGSSDLLMRSRPAGWTRIWTAGNDGAGSGLDADLLDGQDGSFYTNIVARLGYTPYNAALVPIGFGAAQSGVSVSSVDPDTCLIGGTYFSNHSNNGYGGAALAYVTTLGGGDTLGRGFQLSSSYGTADILMRSRPNGWTRIWTAGNDGAGSGLDADLLDGRDATSFADASHSHVAADLAPAFAAQSLAANGYQVLPGGLLLQWGQYRSFYAGEGPGPTINFPRAFSAAPFSITTTTINSSASNSRDTAVQTTTRTDSTFSIYYQNNGGGGGNIDGFDWFAIGPA